MPRTARIVIPGHPHHITQRGNRRMPVFFRPEDYALYLSLIAEQAKKHSVSFWCWCLMDNHVHFIAVPQEPEALALMFREGHRRYTSEINRREGWTGHLWQDRFASFPMDESHALMAARYIETNPVAAGMVPRAGDYKWSSARYHLGLSKNDPLISGSHPLRDLAGDWGAYLGDGHQKDEKTEKERELLLKHEKSGSPLTLRLRLGTE